MAKNYKPYLQKAFRQVVKDILSDVAKNGLDGESHYFITFQTNRDDVIIPDFVRAKYPEEISIILQNQFSNLIIHDSFFCVDLSFGGVNSTLTIPFIAIKVFADPSVQFMLTFEPESPSPKTQTQSKKETNTDDIIDLTALRSKK